MFIGKIVGALGGLYWGIPGIAVGILIGHFFDYGYKRSTNLTYRIDAVQQAFFVATFTLIGKLAKVDGRVTPEEITAVSTIMQDLQLNEQQKRAAIELFRQGKSPDFDIQPVIEALLTECRAHHDLLQFFIEFQVKVAISDGELSSAERELLTDICNKLGFSIQQFINLSDKPQDPLLAAYAVLGLNNNASMPEIKTAYRKLMSSHHPDKLAAKGLPPEMLQVAKEKCQEITAAYDLINKSRR